MQDKTYCPHCYPEPPNHEQIKADTIIDYYIRSPIIKFFSALLPKSTAYFFDRYITTSKLYLLDKLHIIKRTTLIERSQLRNSVLVLWDEAIKRNLLIFNFKKGDKHTLHFVLVHNSKNYYFEYNPVYLVTRYLKHYTDAAQYDDKAVFKETLMKNKLPCPEGIVFTSPSKALAYGITLKYPLMVKPATSSLSRHVTVNIKSEQALKSAIALAKQIDCRIVVERYIPGDVYRALIVDNKLIACAKRQPGSIVGDGKSTVEQLIDEKNNHPWRGEPQQRNFTLHKIKKNNLLRQFLRGEKIDFETVLKKGQQVFLAQKVNTGSGADIINVTDKVHPENKKLLERTAEILNLPLVGLDFICHDVSMSWQKQSFAIIENNSLPFIDMHHFPSQGEPINVAGAIWDFVLKTLS